MKSKKAIVLIVIAAVVVAVLGIGLNKVLSPQYTLMKTISDVKSDGYLGLEEHLTENAKEEIESIVSLTNNNLASGVLSLVLSNIDANKIKSELSEVTWSLEDVLKSGKKAEVVVGFNYKDRLSGTVGITMIREGLEWKIDGVQTPNFDSLF